MGRFVGVDLRERVLAAIEAGMSHREAVERFSVGVAGAWYRLWRTAGSVAPARQGPPNRSKLDPHEAFIVGLIEAQKDITLAEIATRLADEKDVGVPPSTVWSFFDKRGITRK